MRSLLIERMELIEDETLYPFTESLQVKVRFIFAKICGVHSEGRKAKLARNVSC